MVLQDGPKKVQITIDGLDINVELISGFPPGTRAEVVADDFLRDFAIKDKVSHKPHIHTPEGTTIDVGT